jgi:hypothetical protein
MDVGYHEAVGVARVRSASMKTRWLMAIVAAVAMTLPVSWSVKADADLWWHVASGRLIRSLGAIPIGDPWSYSYAGAPWVNHEWLSGLVLSGVFDLAGAPGLLALRALLLVGLLTAWLWVVRDRIPNDVLAVGLLIVPWPFVMLLSNLRPQTITWALVPVVIALVDAVARGSRVAAFALVAVVWAWANLHGGFLFGWGVAGLGLLMTAVGWERPGLERRHRLLCLGLAPLLGLVPLLTPNGFALVAYIWTELTSAHPDLAEWNPPDGGLLALVLAGGLLPWGLYLVTRNRIRPTLAVALAIATVQSLSHAKFVVLVLLLSAIAVAEVTGPWVAGRLERDEPLRRLLTHPATLVAALALAAGCMWTFRTPGWGTIPIDGERYAHRAVAWLDQAESPAGGRLQLPLGWGGQAIYWLHPRWTVGNDGRNTTVYPAWYVEQQTEAWSAGDLEALLDPMLDAVLAPSDSPVSRRLKEDPDWKVAYQDPTATVFVRSEIDVRGPSVPVVRDAFP